MCPCGVLGEVSLLGVVLMERVVEVLLAVLVRKIPSELLMEEVLVTEGGLPHGYPCEGPCLCPFPP